MRSSASLVTLLEHRAATQPDDEAYLFLSDRGAREAALTFAQLRDRARGVAAGLLQKGAPGDRALLIFPQGLDFIVAFFGCLMAGVIAVPMMVPRRQSTRDSSASIVADCAPRFIMTSAPLLTGPRKDVAARFSDSDFEWIVVDATAAPNSESAPALPPIARETIAFLQLDRQTFGDIAREHADGIETLQFLERRFAIGDRTAKTVGNFGQIGAEIACFIHRLDQHQCDESVRR